MFGGDFERIITFDVVDDDVVLDEFSMLGPLGVGEGEGNVLYVRSGVLYNA